MCGRPVSNNKKQRQHLAGDCGSPKEEPMTRNQLRIALAFLASTLGGTALAEDGVSDGKIVFGQVAALTGPRIWGRVCARASWRRSTRPIVMAASPAARLN
jgi:hypothetical protein